ncbi:MAG TPA: gluconokinase [bacterium]|nr:gluconokinase [bacterium]
MSTVGPRDAERPVVLALDMGSGSLRAIFYDRLGREVAGTEGRTATAWTRTSDGGVEADAEALVAGVGAAIDAALAGLGDVASEIRAVGVSTFWHNVLGIDAAGRPLTPLYSWADGRSAAAVAALRERLDEEAVRRRTGCVFHPSYLPARLLWLRTARAGVFRAVRTWMSIGEYLTLRLFGRAVCSISMASGTGMLDLRRCGWDGEVLDAVGLSTERLCPLGDLDAPLCGLAREYASRWPALARVPWLPAAGDGALSNIGTACVGRGRTALSLGTSGALRVLWPGDVPDVPRALWVYRADRRRVLTGGAVSNGGSVYRWLRDQFVLADPAETDAALRDRPPDSHGLVMLPFLSGERSPAWPAASRGAIVGMTLATQPLDLVQAALEAVAYRLALIWDALSALRRPHGPGDGAGEIVASGGALAHLPVWLQIIADVLGREIIRSAEDEGSSRGAALSALEVLGALRTEDMSVPRAAVVRPDPSRHARYQDARARHARVEHALEPLQPQGAGAAPPAPAAGPVD